MDFRLGLLSVFFAFFSTVVFAAPWDYLRGTVAGVDLIEPAIIWILFFVSLGVAAIALFALRRKFSKRLCLVTAAFVLFFIKGILVVLDMYVSAGNFFNYSVQAFFDLVIIACLFAALLWK